MLGLIRLDMVEYGRISASTIGNNPSPSYRVDKLGKSVAVHRLT